MSSIDQRVVSMKFDNAQFERGVKQTTSTLDRLKKALKLDGVGKGLKGLADSTKGFTLNGMASAVKGIAGKFTNLGIVGVTALANIANRAVDAGIQLGKSLTVDPIMDGFREYELKMGSIQTILANTARHGTGLDDVTASLDELNEYADKTIYNFGDMTKNIGLFTNAGIDVGPATSMIKGFSNAAAASGTSSQGAAGAAYQLSQAMSAGTIRLMDWRSLTNVGMGNKNMQDGIIEIAEAMGEFEGSGISATEAGEDFNGSLEKNWLSADVMSNYLQIMAGDMDAAAMSAMGLSDAQIKNFQAQQKTAEEAATKVRTFTQLIDTLQEAVGSSWSETFDILFGDFNEATELFTNVAETLDGIIGGMGDARNKLLTGWDELGGRAVLIEAISNAFQALMAIMKPIGDAFKQIFPPMTAQTLYDMTVALKDFTAGLKVGDETAQLIQRTFAGFFAVIGIGWEIVKGLFGVLLDLFGVAQDGSGSFLEATASIGDFLVAIHEAIKNGDALGKVFDVLGGIIQVIVGIVSGAVGVVVGFAKALGGLFSGKGFDFSGFGFLEGVLDKLVGRFKGFGKAVGWAVDAAKDLYSIIEQVWNILAKGDFISGVLQEDSGIVDFLFDVRDAFEQVWNILAKGDFVGGFFEEDSAIVDWLFKIREAVLGFFDGFNFSTLLDMFNTGLFAGLILLFQGFFKDITGLFSGEGGGLIGSITDTFDNLTGTLEAMQSSLKADTLIKIAGAIAILAAAVLLLSLIDSEDLTKSLTAMAIMFTQLGASMAIFEKVATGPGFAKMPVVAAAMILLSIAVNILALAVRQLSGLSWEELAKGLLGVGGALLLLAGWAKLMEKQSGPLLRAATAMIVVGAAVHILAGAVDKFSDMSWEDMLQGLAGVAGVLLAVAGFGRLGGGGTLKGAISVAIVGGALHILVGPLEKLGNMSTDTLIQGLIGIAGALLVMAAGLSAMSGSIAGAASLVIAAAALWVLVPLLVTLGEMSWNEIAKAAVMLAGALLIIAGGMYLMTGIIVGAASLLIVVAALWVLVPLLVQLGEMSWEEIGKAATILAGSLIIIAGAMYLMTGALPGAAALVVVAAALRIMIPVLIALSQLTWGELLVGLAGLAGALTVVGIAGLLIGPVVPALMGLGAAILLLGAGAALAGAGMLAFALGFTALGAAVAVNGVVMIQLVKDLIGLIPYAAEQIGLGLVAVAKIIIGAAPTWTQAIIVLIESLLRAINTLYPKMAETAWGLIQTLMDVLVDNIPTLVQKGFELLLGIMRGIRDNIQQVVEVGLDIIVNFIRGVENGLPRVVNAAYEAMITFIEELANTLENNQARMERASRRLAEAIVKALVGGIGSFIGGFRSTWRDKVGSAIDNARNAVVNRAKTIARNIVDGLKNSFVGRVASFANSVRVNIGNGITRARDYVVNRAKNLASNIISGLRDGLFNGASRVTSAAKNVANRALDGAKNALGIKSPSREFRKIGQWSSEGFSNGILEYGKLVGDSSASVGTTAIKSLQEKMREASDVIPEALGGDPVIRPVLDLSAVQQDAKSLNGILGGSSLNPRVTAGQATLISQSSARSGSDAAQVNQPINYVQNNYSPKALSTSEIYRRTNNQISRARNGNVPIKTGGARFA